MEKHLLDAIGRIPLLQGFPPQDLDSERLGGLTNLVYRISTDRKDYCLRIPGEGTESYIDRKVEKHNTQLAVSAGVSPQIYYFSDDGLMLTEFLNRSETMSPERFQSDESVPYEAGRAFRKLHRCGLKFKFRFEVFSMIDEYLAVLAKGKTIQLPDGYREAVERSKLIQNALDAKPVQLAPCHCDPLCENFLKRSDRMWIVDWEYSGMNDPYWDLGDLSVEAGLSQQMERQLLTGYFGQAPSEFDVARMVMYKALCDLLWTLWGLIQHMNDNPAEDFWAYSIGRFRRCTKLMSSDEFPRHIKALTED